MYIAVVGSRTISPGEAETAHLLGFSLAKQGVTVVSGLAHGVDSAALWGAVKARQPAIAVLPTAPCEGIYPPKNRVLAQQIQENGGSIIAPYQNPVHHAWQLTRRLIERNYLMALYCASCIVVSDKPVIEGGTAWMVSFCASQNKSVVRLDSNKQLHIMVSFKHKRINWVPELPALKEYIR